MEWAPEAPFAGSTELGVGVHGVRNIVGQGDAALEGAIAARAEASVTREVVG